jgi:hypothetical protein
LLVLSLIGIAGAVCLCRQTKLHFIQTICPIITHVRPVDASAYGFLREVIHNAPDNIFTTDLIKLSLIKR